MRNATAEAFGDAQAAVSSDALKAVGQNVGGWGPGRVFAGWPSPCSKQVEAAPLVRLSGVVVWYLARAQELIPILVRLLRDPEAEVRTHAIFQVPKVGQELPPADRQTIVVTNFMQHMADLATDA